MAPRPIKITYIPAQFRVRAEISKADSLLSQEPPSDLLERAKAKLRREKRSGRVDFYRVFKTRLFATWQALRQSNDPLHTTVAITLATGAPPMPGIEINQVNDQNRDDGSLVLLSLTVSPASLTEWGFKLFKLKVGKILRTQNIKMIPDAAQLQSIWLRATWGEKIKDVPLFSVPAVDPDEVSKKQYEIMLNPEEGAIFLKILDVRALHDLDLTGKVLADVRKAVKLVSETTGKNYEIQSTALVRELRSVNRGPERFGIDLPFMWLAALATPPGYQSRMPEAGKKQVSVGRGGVSSVAASSWTNTLADFIKVEIAADKMTAKIAVFDHAYYRTGASFSRADITAACRYVGVTHGCDDEFYAIIEEKIAAKVDLTGLVVAAGKSPIHAETPFLELTFQRPPDAALAHASQDMRDQQQRGLVHAGQAVATIRFKVDPIPGFDVCGLALPPKLPVLPDIKFDAHIDRRDLVTFIAKIDGVPSLDGDSLSLTPGLVHKGDVNLTSGNIDFAGSVEILGSIDTGARVFVRGDLIVRGMIRGAQVKASGSLQVDGGIVTGETGWVRVRGDLKSGFIENSQIRVGGQIEVSKSIVACHIEATGNVRLPSPDGQIIGGSLLCQSDVMAAKIGRSAGARTLIWVGVNAKAQRRILLLQKRQNQLEKTLSDTQSDRRQRHRKGRLESSHEVSATPHLERVERCQNIITRIKASLAQAKAAAQFNSAAKIIATQLLSLNCEVKVAEHVVLVPSDLAAVQISSRRKNGSFIAPLDETDEAAQAS